MNHAADHGWTPVTIPALRGALSFDDERRDRIVATFPPLIAGMLVFGLGAAVIALGCSLACLVFARLLTRVRRGRRGLTDAQAVLIGLLLALTMPPSVGWQAVLAGALIAIVVGIGMQRGPAEYVWHPALVGRIGAQVFFPGQLMPSEWPLLARGNLFFGDIRRVAAPAEYFGWSSTPAPDGAEGFLLPSVQTVLRALPETVSPDALDGPSRLTVLIRDALPPWEDTVLGLTPGGIGETSTIALLAAAAYLVYRGIAEARVPAVAVLAALLTAALLPLTLPGETGLAIPTLLFDKGDPVGWLFVLFEVTTSEIMIVAAFFVTDWPTTPVARRGRVVFAALVGALTVILARIGLVPGAGYWAVLAINALTPLIDRLFAQRVLGTRGAARVDAIRARRYISTS